MKFIKFNEAKELIAVIGLIVGMTLFSMYALDNSQEDKKMEIVLLIELDERITPEGARLMAEEIARQLREDDSVKQVIVSVTKGTN
jgi:protein involved in sex pheromone biosynthesis